MRRGPQQLNRWTSHPRIDVWLLVQTLPLIRGTLSISQQRADLWGRLSNPPEAVETLAGQGSQASCRPRKTIGGTPNRASERSAEAPPEEKGRLSNPVQRRLSDAEVDELAKCYIEGTSIDALARVYRVHRTTVIGHLDRRQIPRRRVVRKMIDRTVEDAAAAYGGAIRSPPSPCGSGLMPERCAASSRRTTSQRDRGEAGLLELIGREMSATRPPQTIPFDQDLSNATNRPQRPPEVSAGTSVARFPGFEGAVWRRVFSAESCTFDGC